MVAPDDNPCRQVDRRQCLLRMGSHLAAAESLVPRFAAAQTFTATSISQAAQDARRDVGQRAGPITCCAARLPRALCRARGGADFRTEQAPLAREPAAIFNSRVAEDDWRLIVPTAELGLVLEMRPLVIRIAPRPEEVEAVLKEPLPRSKRWCCTRSFSVRSGSSAASHCSR